MQITAPILIRWTGLAALVGGIIFAGIQPIHPPDVLASVTTGTWAIIISLKLLMCFLFLTGIAGLYARQAEEAGWLGLIGFVLFSASWALQSGFVFADSSSCRRWRRPHRSSSTATWGSSTGRPG